MKKTMDLIKNASCSNSPKENSQSSPNRPPDRLDLQQRDLHQNSNFEKSDVENLLESNSLLRIS